MKFLDSDNFDQFNEISFAGQNKSIDIQLDWTGKTYKAKLINAIFTKCVRDEKYIALARPSPH